MHIQQDVFNGSRSVVPAARSSTMAATWFAVMEERNRLAAEIHDTLAQAFAGILLQLESVPQIVAAGGQLGSDSDERLTRAKHLAKSGLEDSRRMLLGLRPKALDGASLTVALKALAQRCASDWRIVCKVRFFGRETNPPNDIQDEFYRIAQEALTNAGKHARANSVWVGLAFTGQQVVLTIRDDGVGLMKSASAQPGRSYGLTTMRERARRIGAQLEIESPEDGGTSVRVCAPLAKTDRVC